METSKDANDQDMKDDTEALWESLAHGQQRDDPRSNRQNGAAQFQRDNGYFFLELLKHTNSYILEV